MKTPTIGIEVAEFWDDKVSLTFKNIGHRCQLYSITGTEILFGRHNKGSSFFNWFLSLELFQIICMNLQFCKPHPMWTEQIKIDLIILFNDYLILWLFTHIKIKLNRSFAYLRTNTNSLTKFVVVFLVIHKLIYCQHTGDLKT